MLYYLCDMKKYEILQFLIIFNTLFFLGKGINAQTDSLAWELDTLPNMPFRISNNAVTEAWVDGVPHIFSFAGIDSSKFSSGITNRSFRLNLEANEWDTIPPLPMTYDVIAAGASRVKDKIYVIGGYTVLPGTEISFDNVHIYDPQSNTYTAGTPIPRAIDDQVQAVWRDSLIYVVTGWSQTNNYPDVQIYDPANDEWLEGTPTPNNNFYKAFGASGTIIGDTIYYAGGTAYFTNDFFEPFRLVPYLRIGVINPDTPTEIEWSYIEDSLALGYRMAATNFEGKAMWIGGGLVSYNYNGIAYNGSGGVEATDRILTYTPQDSTLSEAFGYIPKVMDLRGVAKIADNEFVIAGGMVENQEVSDQCFAFKWATDTMAIDTMDMDTMMMDTTMMDTMEVDTMVVDTTIMGLNNLQMTSNIVFVFDRVSKQLSWESKDNVAIESLRVWTSDGQLIVAQKVKGQNKVVLGNLPKGICVVQAVDVNGKVYIYRFVN